MSLATGIAFVGYFVPVRELAHNLATLQWFSTSAGWVGIVASLTYLNAGLVREKVCSHMCPYARFQSVMFDRDTKVVAYDAQRGDARGARKKQQDAKALGLGDCIDCTLCVQVCPTGIDIRDGLQMDCIGCAACVDACDDVMDKMGYARGLISYTSEATFAGEQSHWLRPRLLGYVGVLAVMLLGLVVALNSRELVDMSVVKDRSVLYRTMGDGGVMNVYRVKITNKTQQAAHYTLQVNSDLGLYLMQPYSIALLPGDISEFAVRVALPKGYSAQAGLLPFEFVLQAEPGTVQDRSLNIPINVPITLHFNKLELSSSIPLSTKLQKGLSGFRAAQVIARAASSRTPESFNLWETDSISLGVKEVEIIVPNRDFPIGVAF